MAPFSSWDVTDSRTLPDLPASDQVPEDDYYSQYIQRQVHHLNGRRSDVGGSAMAPFSSWDVTDSRALPDLPASDQVPEDDYYSQYIQRQVHHLNGRRRDVGGSAMAPFSSWDVTDSRTLPELPASDQVPEDDYYSQFIQRQVHHPNGRRRDVGGSAMAAFNSCDVTDSGLFRQDELSRENQRNHGNSWNNGGQMSMRRTQSMFNVPVEDNKRTDNLRVNRLCQSTTQNDLSDSTEEMSDGEEVKEVLMLENDNPFVTMADDIKRKLMKLLLRPFKAVFNCILHASVFPLYHAMHCSRMSRQVICIQSKRVKQELVTTGHKNIISWHYHGTLYEM